MAKRATNKRLSRADWLEAALAMVVDVGVERIRVHQLAARMNATTGSLYWHFEDRDGLIRALMDYWEKESTDKVA
ncbi:MAG: TetR/AcrR family transcriptional regulator, partial [Planctomycetota bacterium]